ncbi:bifunctional DNA primase/polymerase [Carnobacterium sp. ISL-102]|uniref:bifunctional DNA primase/polymerase n=1 Tax=Carnobacterium sp. ISL-102 TaxID=2819142 RepID=UPI001BE4EE40|nr:bifunctional DNA primase/polymerase [Carnobacterium sp. ISL-102]MBT2731656.1 bifunctional DNA primase/polymerase [Carnobacterium sp. ISL-102]
MAYESLLIEALELSKTFKIYKLAPMTNIPLKGSRGELDATQDQQTILDWFEKDPLISIGISLKDSNVLVLDIDDHDETGEVIKELASLTNGNSLEDAVIVKTPRGKGFHAFYSYPSNLTIENDSNFRNGIELLTTKVTAPSSRKKLKDGSIGEYVLKSGSLSDIKPCPQWLLNAITSKQQGNKSNTAYTLNFNDNGKPKTFYTAKFMTELMAGTLKGSRNSWITQQYGRMISLGMSYTVAYEWIRLVNENFVDKPISDSELNKIVLSITKREQQKMAHAERSD